MSRSVIPALLSLAAAFLLTGCLKTTFSIEIKPDGSGTLTRTVVADQSKSAELMQALEQMGMGGGMGGGGNPGDLPELDYAKSAAAVEHIEGVRVVSGKSLDDAAKHIKGSHMVVAFDSLQALAKSGLVRDLSLKLEKNEDGSYGLTLKTIPAQMEGVNLDDPNVQMQLEMAKSALPMMEPYIGNFQIAATVKLPTEILKPTGQRTNPARACPGSSRTTTCSTCPSKSARSSSAAKD